MARARAACPGSPSAQWLWRAVQRLLCFVRNAAAPLCGALLRKESRGGRRRRRRRRRGGGGGRRRIRSPATTSGPIGTGAGRMDSTSPNKGAPPQQLSAPSRAGVARAASPPLGRHVLPCAVGLHVGLHVPLPRGREGATSPRGPAASRRCPEGAVPLCAVRAINSWPSRPCNPSRCRGRSSRPPRRRRPRTRTRWACARPWRPAACR